MVIAVIATIITNISTVCLFRTWAEHSQDHPIRMRGLRTAALMRHVGPAVPTSAVFCLQKSHACWVSACFRTPRLSLGHPGSLTSVHVLKCMRTQTAPLFNVPRGRHGTTTRVIHPYPHGTSRAGNRTRVVVGGVQSANRYTTGPADIVSKK